MHLLATSFPALHSRDKQLPDVPLARTNKYGKESVKHLCIRDSDWSKLQKEVPSHAVPQIPENELSNMV